jgi:GNAT superfamily N-acetyltransferase
MNKHSFIGGKSKGKTLSDVAQMHGMTTDELRPQYKKGTEHELEHTTSVVIARRIALDHLVEFPDYYDRLDKIEKMKKGAVVEKPMIFNDMVLYYERKGNWLFAKGNFYAWLYDQDGAGKKVETGEYDFIMFPPMGKGSPFSEKYVPPLLMVWQKSYQKNYKGSEHLLGIVKGFYDEDKNQLIIDMMTSNPKFRRKGINAHIIKQLRTEFGVSQDNVIFDKPTKEGKLFESSKKYEEGGVMSYREYVNTQFDEEEDRYLPSGYLEEFEILRDKKDVHPILYRSKNGFEYRIKNNTNSQIGVFDGNKMIGYADDKAIMVAPSYQKKGIGLELVTILKERNPDHRFGSMTPEGMNLLGKYYDEKIAKKSDSTFDKGGLLDFVSSKSLIVKIGNDSYKIQYQKDEIGSTEKNVWFANVIAKNEIEVKGRLCYADEYVAVIHGMNLNDVSDEIMDFYKSNDLYLIIQDEFGKVTETRHIESNDSNMFAKGGRTIAQTPAPKSDRVSGSKTNPKGSASDSYLGKSIKFNDALIKAIQNKVDEYNEKHPSDKVSLATAKAVVRRGFGAYSKSHRPTITGGAPNSRQAWGLARLNKFLIKKSGGKVKSAYIQDDDLL